MDLLIVYSETTKTSLLSLSTLLEEKSIRFHPMPLPEDWTIGVSEDLLHYLKDHTHWVFLLSDTDFANPAFLFSAGYCIALQERCYLLDDSSGSVPGYWKNLMNICPDFPALVQALEVERERWLLFLSRLEAKGKIVDRGLEVSNTAFLESIEKGDTASCELFLDAGFSPDLTNKKGVSLLGLAVRSLHLGVTRLLLDRGADVNLCSRDRENSPLMDAAAEGADDLVRELIQRGANLEGLSRNGQNALVLAIGKGSEAVASTLLLAGADPFVADKLGMNACQYAQLLGRKEFLSQVAERYPGRL